MATIQGFYQLRAYNKSSYKLHYPRTGSPLMRTEANDVRNYQTWMLWQPSDSDASYVQLVSGTNSLFDGDSLYKMLGNGVGQPYNLYELTAINSSIPTVITDSLRTTNDTTCNNEFIKTKVGTLTLDGVVCDVVTFKLPYNGKFLDYTKALENQNNPLTLEDESGGATQKFILEPINCFDNSLVAPSSIYLQYTKGVTSNFQRTNWRDRSVYIMQWTDSSSTINNGYTTRYQTQSATLSNSDAWTYADTSGWSDYATSDIYTRGNLRWGKAVAIPECSTSIKAVKEIISLQTSRTLTVFGSTLLFVSAVSSQEFVFAKKPTLTKDGLAWTPDGMKINFTSDYFGQGSMKLTFRTVRAGSSNLLIKSYATSIVKDTTITIPTDYFSRPPTDNEELTITLALGTDVYSPTNYFVTLTDTLTYDEGNVTITPTVTELDGLRFKVDVPYANTVKAWMSVNGENILLSGTVSGGHTIYEVMPPFCTEYALFVSYENSDSTKWGTAYVSMPTINIRAHAFTWDGGSCVIWLNKDEALTESFAFSPQSTTHTLVGRSHDVVTYLSDGEKNYTSVTGDVKGYIVPSLETYGTTRDSIEKMVEQGHVVYRAPYGRICNVAVTGADITTDKGISEVSVSIVQEDD